MSSNLRFQSDFAPVSAQSYSHVVSPRPQKKQRMTITQSYRLAHSARGKLSSEASRGDHDLRLLVGHANLLDSLMLELQDAENEQEAWFNETMKSSKSSSDEPKHIQWVDEIISERQSEEDDSESDSDDEELEVMAPLRKVRSPPAPLSHIEYYGSDEEEDEEEDYEEDSDDEFDNLDLALVRTRSRRNALVEEDQSSPPELVHDNSDDSDDESASSPSSPPSSPPQLSIPLSEIHKQQGIKAQDFSIPQKPQSALLEDGYFLPPREEQTPLIAAY